HHRYLADDSIEQTLERADYSLIFFYSETCQYCQIFNPTFDYVSVLFNTPDASSWEKPLSTKLPFQVLKTNGNSESRLTQLFLVASFPTLKLLNYNTMEIISYNYNDRELATVMGFIADNVPQAVPNYDNFRSPVVDFSSTTAEGILAQPATLIVFITSYLKDWKEYQYPTHFFQQLAAGDKFSGVKFGVVDVSESTSDIVTSFRVSTYPSLMYVGENGSFKTWKTQSQSHLTNDQLAEAEIVLFLADL
ncbi:uncharacterized protein CANTADRAFT_34556, partial [Suhomyces tanzawaensis NRRL Y-17324]